MPRCCFSETLPQKGPAQKNNNVCSALVHARESMNLSRTEGPCQGPAPWQVTGGSTAG